MSSLVEAIKLASFPIHKEGYKFIIIFALATIILSLLSDTLGLIGLVLTLWCIFFFRDPERIIPKDSDAIISPADGVITVIDKNVSAPDELDLDDKKFTNISIFVNVFNVHVNRVPAGGVIKKVAYQPGKFLSANDKDASTENERNSVLLEIKKGKEVVFTQVAGLVARRIVSELKEGQKVLAGERYGIIRFGSRLDIYLPKEAEIKSQIGQTMIGGETIIAKF